MEPVIQLKYFNDSKTLVILSLAYSDTSGEELRNRNIYIEVMNLRLTIALLTSIKS